MTTTTTKDDPEMPDVALSELTYTLTEDDYEHYLTYIETKGKRLRRASIARTIAVFVIGLIIIGQLTFGYAYAYRLKDPYPWTVLLGLAVVNGAFIWWHRVQIFQELRLIPGCFGVRRLSVTNEYVEFVRHTETSRLSWSSYRNAVLWHKWVFLEIDARNAAVIPASAFSSPDEAALFAARMNELIFRARPIAEHTDEAKIWPPRPTVLNTPAQLSWNAPEPNVDTANSVELAYKLTFDECRSAQFDSQLITACLVYTVAFIWLTGLFALLNGMQWTLRYLLTAYFVLLLPVLLLVSLTFKKRVEASIRHGLFDFVIKTDFLIMQMTMGKHTAVSTLISDSWIIHEKLTVIILLVNPRSRIFIPKRVFSSPAAAAEFVSRMRIAIADAKAAATRGSDG